MTPHPGHNPVSTESGSGETFAGERREASLVSSGEVCEPFTDSSLHLCQKQTSGCTRSWLSFHLKAPYASTNCCIAVYLCPAVQDSSTSSHRSAALPRSRHSPCSLCSASIPASPRWPATVLGQGGRGAAVPGPQLWAGSRNVCL